MKTAVIACEVFRRELEYLKIDSSDFVFFEIGLHDNPSQLSKQIQTAIDAIESDTGAVKRILLLYGFCGGGLLNIRSNQAELIIPRAHDCLALFLGSNQQYEKDQRTSPGTYYFSPGWMDGGRIPGPGRESYLRECFAEKYDKEMIEELIEMDAEAFGHYHTGFYVDTIGDKNNREHCETCVRHNNWKFRSFRSDLNWLKKTFTGPYDDPNEFLVKKPGDDPIKITANGLIFK